MSGNAKGHNVGQASRATLQRRVRRAREDAVAAHMLQAEAARTEEPPARDEEVHVPAEAEISIRGDDGA